MTLERDDTEWLHAVRHGHPPGEFGHREHLRLAWLALGESATTDAAQHEVSRIIRALASAQGVPQRYNRTVTDAWVRIVAHCRAQNPAADFEEMLRAHPFVRDKRALMKHYTSRTLASTSARQRWVEPDVLPIPPA